MTKFPVYAATKSQLCPSDEPPRPEGWRAANGQFTERVYHDIFHLKPSKNTGLPKAVVNLGYKTIIYITLPVVGLKMT